jgi:hypothetical protein
MTTIGATSCVHPQLVVAWGPIGSCDGLVGEDAPAFDNGYRPLVTGTCWGLAVLHLRLLAFARWDPAAAAVVSDTERDALLRDVVRCNPIVLPALTSVRALTADVRWQPRVKRAADRLWARHFFNPLNLAVVAVNTPAGNLRTLDLLERRLATGDKPLVQLQAGVFHQHVAIAWRVDRLAAGSRLCLIDSNHHTDALGPSVFLDFDHDGRVTPVPPGRRGPMGSVPSGPARHARLGIRPAPRGEREARAVLRRP